MKNIMIQTRKQAFRLNRNSPKTASTSSLNVIQSDEITFVYYHSSPIAIFPNKDKFARNVAIVSLYLNQKIKQEDLARAFVVGERQIQNLFKAYRKDGLIGLMSTDTSQNAKQYPVIKCSQTVSDLENRIAAIFPDADQELIPVHSDLQFSRVSKQNDDGGWIPMQYAGAFLLFAFLKKMNLFERVLSVAGPEVNHDRLIRLVLTLFFMTALRFKSIEQGKFIDAKSFSFLVEGSFQKLQHFRYALDDLAESSFFPVFVQEFFGVIIEESLKQCERLFYIDGHFSPYYGSKKIPFGYDTKRQRGFPGRSTVFVHDESGKNVIFFESPTNNSLHQDLAEVMSRLKSKLGDLTGISLFFDRGGFCTDTFKNVTQEGAYFTTFLKNRKKEASLPEEVFIEAEIEVNQEKRKIKIYEKERSTRSYGEVRIIVFIGREGRQIPILSTEPTRSAAEIVERMKGRWKEENCFKFMVDHYAFDLMSTYKMVQSPEKLIDRPNPERKDINTEIREKKTKLAELHRELSEKVHKSKHKTTTTLSQLRKNNPLLYAKIDTLELEILSLERIRRATIPTVQTNLADAHYVSDQKRRLLINMVKSLNYNCEKSLQELLQAFHPKSDETLAIIIQLIQQPGKIRVSSGTFEVEVDRLPTEQHAKNCDQLITELSKQNLLTTPFGTEIVMRQGGKAALSA